MEWTGKKSYRVEWVEELGDGRAEESSAIGDGEQAALLVMPDINGISVHVFESLQLEDLYVGDLLYINRNLIIRTEPIAIDMCACL